MAEAQRSSAFDRFHPSVQRLVWRLGWSQLNSVQEQAAGPILEGNVDLVITAPTGGGKTEAAYFPLLSRVLAEDLAGIRALYISPLKALINDQFQRLESLTEEMDLPVHRWHGDIASSKKKKLLKEPSGLLLITPESLEAIFVNHGTKTGRIFTGLSHVIVDELHSFIGTERGRQMQSLLHRVETAIDRRVPRIGLSATLGDLQLALNFLRPGGGNTGLIIENDTDSRELQLQLKGYRLTAPAVAPSTGDQVPSEDENLDLVENRPGDAVEISRHMLQTLRGADNLVFANRRMDVEKYADMLARLSAQARLPSEFWAHHGSLSKELREAGEEALKGSRPATVVCTSTLEMGIDVGSVASIAQIGCPPSVASMRQRLGRSGRREDAPAVLRIYIQEDEVVERTTPQDSIRSELIQTIAMVRLMVYEHWCEPPNDDALHLSTLVQQLLSSVAQFGGIRPQPAWKLHCEKGPFKGLDTAAFARLLRSLGQHDLVVQDPDGALLLGQVGERIVNHYSFYAAFQSPEEFRLVCRGRPLGTLPIDSPLFEGTFIIFGARRWEVEAVDQERKVVDLIPARGGKVPGFAGSSGALVHDRVRAEMLKLYLGADQDRFLDGGALDLLEEGRANFRRLGLVEQRIIPNGPDSLLFSWAGDRVLNTLSIQLSAMGVKAARAGVALSVSKTSPTQLLEVLRDLAAQEEADPTVLASTVKNKASEKYDLFLDEDLLCQDYGARALDPAGALRVVRHISAFPGLG